LTAGRLLEEIELVSVEVVREAVAKTAPQGIDHAPDRAVVEPVRGDLAEVVVLDLRDRLAVERHLIVDEDIANRVGQLGWMAAQPKAHAEDGRQRDPDGRRPQAHRWLKPSGSAAA
jgi:hypothetical protein